MKFLDLESGRLLEVGAYSRLGAYYNFTIFSISNFILQQNVKMLDFGSFTIPTSKNANCLLENFLKRF